MAWPDYVPIVVSDQMIGQDSDVVRSRFEDGLVRQERRYDTALHTWSITALIDHDDDLARFRAWARREAHTWFIWTDITTGAARRVRVRDGAGGITLTAAVSAARRRWEATLTLEGWPDDTL